MHLVMFDIDGTLVDTAGFEDPCFLKAVRNVVSVPFDTHWSNYAHATDSGILDEIIDLHGLGEQRHAIQEAVRTLFTHYIGAYLEENPAEEIKGASAFINGLKTREDVVLAIATGGWEATAKMKLESAGIDHSGIAFASGSDATSRTRIMALAEEQCGQTGFATKTYFGDAAWDQQACRQLGYQFILVGNSIVHDQQISDFQNREKVLSLIGWDQTGVRR